MTLVSRPPGLSWAPPWSVYRESEVIGVTLDPTSLKPTTTDTIYVSTLGSDANDGSSMAPGHALRSLRHALGVITGPTTIYVSAGLYDWTYNWHNVAPAHDVAIIALGGRARFIEADTTATWSVNGTYADVYQAAAPTTVYSVVDLANLNATLLGTRLTLQASIANVHANAGSWYYAAGTVYVRTADDRAPDADILALLDFIDGSVNSSSVTAYIEGVDFLGGTACLSVADAQRVVGNDCTFRYAKTVGSSIVGAVDSYLFDCDADENVTDGLSYTSTSKVLEVRCRGRNNGYDGSDINNGSTTHGGAMVIRVGGVYTDNQGPNVADVGGGTSWCVGTEASGTRATTGTQQVNFYTDGAMYLDYCEPSDNTLDLVADLGGAAYVLQTEYDTSSGSIIDRERPGPTTEAAIRETMITQVKRLTPTSRASNRFQLYDESADFRTWALENPQACLRWFSIRDDGKLEGTGGDCVQEWVSGMIEVVVAYPNDQRYGNGRRGLDDIISRDLAQIDHTIGTAGFALYGDGAVVTDGRDREETAAVFFAVLRLKASFWRSVS